MPTRVSMASIKTNNKILLSFLFSILICFETSKNIITFLGVGDAEAWIPESRRACRVVIENKVDFHHEVLESVVLRFPLPFHEYNCSMSKPIIYDFALFQNRFHLRVPGLTGSGATKAQFLNQTEFWGWKSYFEKNLKNKVFNRRDEKNMGTKALFNNLVSYEEISNMSVDAVIDATCDIGPSFIKKMMRNKNLYCVLHGANKKALNEWPEAYTRSCFLSPMWPKTQCQFLAAELPKVRKCQMKKDGLQICVHGIQNTGIAAKLFTESPLKDLNATIQIFFRHNLDKLARLLTQAQVPHNIVKELDFFSYHVKLAQCSTVVVLYEPTFTNEYFPWGDKSSSGIVPALIAYNLSSIMHVEFAKIYQNHLTAPTEVYFDSIKSKVTALTKIMDASSQ